MSREATLVLASASPRRRELLRAAGWRVRVVPAAIDERPRPGESAPALVVRLARAKARRVAAQTAARPVLAADTEVSLPGAILGKPAGPRAAAAMLRRLAGRSHWVHTGVCVIAADGRERAAVAATRVWMRPLSPAEIAAYVAGGEPFDKAGGYAIQGRGARFIARIAGSYSNVVGLPLHLVDRLLAPQLRAPKKEGRRSRPSAR